MKTTYYPGRNERRVDALLVLAHGAGAGQHHPFMTAVARGLGDRGIDVVTFDFPYIEQKRRVPDSPPLLQASFREAISDARGAAEHLRSSRLFLGGKSLGGRMATHLAAEGIDGLAGIVLLGYPLHPPGRPEQLRAGHLPNIAAPVLIVQGERDPFGTPAELQPVLKTMSAAVTLHVVEGGDHSLAVRQRAGGGRQPIDDAVVDVIAGWIVRQCTAGAVEPARPSRGRVD
jgi:predicted alpha/beta-hydrolase family hydrolase